MTMIDIQDRPIQLPLPRETVLTISSVYADLRLRAPILPVTTPTGDPAWIVVAHREAKSIFADKRFGYYTHHDPKSASRMSEAALHAHPMGGVDFEELMVRMRKLLAPGFTPRRLALLQDWVQQLTDQCLDELEAAHDCDQSQPVNFHEMVGFRLPVMVIAALLGFPIEDADYVTGLSALMGETHDGSVAFGAASKLTEYMGSLIASKRENLGEDILSDLIRANDSDPGFFAARPLESFAAGLVFPGHETTVVRIDFGVLYLLQDTSRRDWLMQDPDGRIDQVVEEVLRLTSAHNFGLMRYANEDIDIAGVTIKRGDLVILSDAAANRDPTQFPDPEAFDPTRDNARSHLAFGHGPHNCLGMSLARMELKAAFLSLFRRFPNVRLATVPDSLAMNNYNVGGGVHDVPLIW
jgi:cytochrome P450